MEGVSVCKLNDNKENIPPSTLFLSIQCNNVPDLVSCSSFKSVSKKKRKLRKPLRDITHLFNNQISAPIAHFQNLDATPVVQISASAVNFRKRKADDSRHDTVSKSLRMNFR
ncbi:hypothetical protein POM88_000692 [Heracleum sosnowskyi]|uniref:Uncharacterized protein n=1 Tax=Heracleum sosnowskyi TaxID=360622 RepID=A0AAD8N9M5_9APIA|nr:hypothetical protein POM88_000692 [Heracleum sosnowskyi]